MPQHRRLPCLIRSAVAGGTVPLCGSPACGDTPRASLCVAGPTVCLPWRIRVLNLMLLGFGLAWLSARPAGRGLVERSASATAVGAGALTVQHCAHTAPERCCDCTRGFGLPRTSVLMCHACGHLARPMEGQLSLPPGAALLLRPASKHERATDFSDDLWMWRS